MFQHVLVHPSFRPPSLPALAQAAAPDTGKKKKKSYTDYVANFPDLFIFKIVLSLFDCAGS